MCCRQFTVAGSRGDPLHSWERRLTQGVGGEVIEGTGSMEEMGVAAVHSDAMQVDEGAVADGAGVEVMAEAMMGEEANAGGEEGAAGIGGNTGKPNYRLKFTLEGHEKVCAPRTHPLSSTVPKRWAVGRARILGPELAVPLGKESQKLSSACSFQRSARGLASSRPSQRSRASAPHPRPVGLLASARTPFAGERCMELWLGHELDFPPPRRRWRA